MGSGVQGTGARNAESLATAVAVSNKVLCLYPRSFMSSAMATHSSTLAWKILWTEEPGGLQSMGSLGVGHD